MDVWRSGVHGVAITVVSFAEPQAKAQISGEDELPAVHKKCQLCIHPNFGLFATQEAEAIFGDVDELLAVYEERKYARAATAGEEEGLDDEEEDEGLDEEEAEARRLARVRCRRRCCCCSVVGWLA